MVYYDMPKATAQRIITTLVELNPQIQAKILSEDAMLYQLGFVGDIPCRLEIPISSSDAEELYENEKVISLEIEAFNFSEDEMRDPAIKEKQREQEEHYYKFAFLKPYLLTIMRSEEDEINAGTVEF